MAFDQPAAQDQPQPLPPPPPPPRPEDRDCPMTIAVLADVTDVERRIIRVNQTISHVPAGRLVLLYPKWLPGYHSPHAAIELFAGLVVHAGGRRLEWTRDPVEVHAFQLDVPSDGATLDIEFQFLAPTTSAQGTVLVTDELLVLHWHSAVLYPAGYFARRISVSAKVRLPEGWSYACALEVESADAGGVAFKPAPLDGVVDSPLMAGRHMQAIDLEPGGGVRLNLFAHEPSQLEATDEQLAGHRNLVVQADRLFGARPYDHYDFLVALSDQLGGTGVEHHRSCEITTAPGYFTQWDQLRHRRDTLAHEYVHAWNGKARRGADSWTPSFEQPIRSSLMWVYEGLTQYWGRVLAVRAGLWSLDDTCGALAQTAASYDIRAGRCWRAMIDTTRDPIIAGREPVPWPSWQRSEDYYSEGELVWLGVDTQLRELTGEARSLDDFAQAFFGMVQPAAPTRTYTEEEVLAALNGVAPHDWKGFFRERLEGHGPGAPLDGLERGGYRLVYRDWQSDFCAARDAEQGLNNLMFSIGLVTSTSGAVEEVIWDGPAYDAGLVIGDQVLAVNGEAYGDRRLRQAVAAAAAGGPLALTVKKGGKYKTVELAYTGGLRFPHLERLGDGSARIDRIYAPR